MLARWTIGPVSSIGKDILRESVSYFARLYPEFDRIVCYNHIEPAELYGIDADLHEQTSSIFSLRPPDDNPEEASGCGWKLCPARLRPDEHELWLDNDLVICQRLPSIECWMTERSVAIISEGLQRKRMYGEFDQFVSSELHVCAGLFGLPPGFDFQEKILFYMRFATKPLGGYDEQGLTTAVITNSDEWILVPLSELCIAEDHVPFPDMLPSAVHFVGANRKPWHRGWKSYKSRGVL